MKEDVLEQITADYLNLHGYFVMTNVKYHPCRSDPEYVNKQDSVSSDIDVLAINPLLQTPARVVAVSCKSWQAGFCPESEIEAIKDNKTKSGREPWKAYRELASPKWGRAFRHKVKELTGESTFEHWTVCTWLNSGNPNCWTQKKSFQENLTKHLRILTLDEFSIRLLKRLTLR